MQLQHSLQLSVQSINWTYSIFWQLNPQKQVLEWRDGYYNGISKGKKTVLGPFEVSLEDDAVQRSRQLRDLYDALVSEQLESSSPAPAGLSPEDLTEVEWFYLVSVSFSFSSGEGLPGRAFERQRHVWFTGANEGNRKDLSRAILAKSAGIQTIMCIPFLDGVLEFGTMENVEEDLSVIQHARSFFKENENDKPTLSEQSTSGPVNNSMFGFRHLANATRMNVDAQQGGNDDDDDDDDNEDEGDIGDLEMSEHDGSDISNSVGECAQPSDDECSETISLLPQNSLIEMAKCMTVCSLAHSKNSAFTKWGSHNGNHFLGFISRKTSQRMLKFMLFKVPDLHCTSVQDSVQEEPSTNHVLAERRRREKINKRFIVLRSTVPFVTKMDKTSILESTIEYLKQLQERIEELKSRKEKMGTNLRTMNTETATPSSTNVKVSIIEGNALFKLQCPYRDGLLFKIMQKFHELGLETTSIQSSTINKIFVAELRAKVKEIHGRKATIMEVKRAIYQIFS